MNGINSFFVQQYSYVRVQQQNVLQKANLLLSRELDNDQLKI